jgi:hypothetical protein
MNFGKVLVPTTWGTNVQNCLGNAKGICDPTGWPYASNTDMYFDGNAFNPTGVGNFVTGGATAPWDPTSYQLTTAVSGLPLTGSQAVLPVRFQYVPAQGYAAPRSTVVTSSTGGVIGATDQISGAAISAPAAPAAPTTRSAQTITFPAVPAQKAGTSVTLSALASSKLAVTYTVTSGPATVSGNTVKLTGPGTVTIQAAQAGNTSFAAATPVSQSFAVTAASQTITFAAIPQHTIVDPAFTLSATASSGLAVTFSVVTGPAKVTGNTVTLTGTTGTVVIAANQAGNANYTAAIAVSQSFAVTGAPQTITFAAIPANKYGTRAFTLGATASSGLVVSYAVASGQATVSGNTVTLTGSGTITIQATQAGNSTYAAATPVSQSFAVAQATQTIVFPAIPNHVFGDAPFALTASASSKLPVTYNVVSGPATISGSMVTIKGAGAVVIQASQPGNSGFAAAPPVSMGFTVAP